MVSIKVKFIPLGDRIVIMPLEGIWRNLQEKALANRRVPEAMLCNLEIVIRSGQRLSEKRWYRIGTLRLWKEERI